MVWNYFNSDGLFAHGVVVNSVLFVAGPAGAWKYSGSTWTDITGKKQSRIIKGNVGIVNKDLYTSGTCAFC